MKTFFIADTHFDHKKIMLDSYEPCRVKGLGLENHSAIKQMWMAHASDPLGADEMTRLVWAEAANVMNERILQRWNAVVGPGDYVFHLGDVAFKSIKGTWFDAHRLNGTKLLVPGNHDPKPEVLQTCGWIVQDEHVKTLIHGIPVLLSHKPVSTEELDAGGLMFNIHGHMHSRPLIPASDRHICVSLETINFQPLALSELAARMKARM